MKLKCNCEYCLTKDYLWSLGDGRLWVEIPKNGSASIKASRQLTPLAPLTHSFLDTDEGRRKDIFCILRDPIERFKSLIAHYFIHGGRLKFGKKWIEHRGISEYSQENVVDIFFAHLDCLEEIYEAHHFSSQTSFIPDQFWFMNPVIYTMKDLTSLTGLHINASKSNNIFLSEKNEALVKKIYKKDCDLYIHRLVQVGDQTIRLKPE